MQTFRPLHRLLHRHVHVLLGSLIFILSGCAGVNTFPTAARPGDTVSVMVGGSEQARKDNINVSLIDSSTIEWDLQSIGSIRSVFNLRASGTAYGEHYSSWLDSEYSWLVGHEPIQTILVVDIPTAVALGPATLNVNLNTSDDSSGVSQPFSISMNIIDGTGTTEEFLRQNFNNSPVAASLIDLEPAPYAKISFGGGGTSESPDLYATSLIVDFDETVVNGDDLNIYAPQSNVRGSYNETGAFGNNQKSVFWRHDGDRLYIDIIAPNGIEGRYAQIYIVHPRGLAGDPNLNLISTVNYDANGQSTIFYTPSFQYFP